MLFLRKLGEIRRCIDRQGLLSFRLFIGVKICLLRPTCRRPDCRHISPETVRRQPAVAAVARLTEQQSGDHPAQQHQPGLVAALAVLTQEDERLSVKPGVGTDWGVVEQPRTSVVLCSPKD